MQTVAESRPRWRHGKTQTPARNADRRPIGHQDQRWPNHPQNTMDKHRGLFSTILVVLTVTVEIIIRRR
jgi:hypothetical protein